MTGCTASSSTHEEHEEHEERKVDRSAWPRGSWDNEPDRAEWEHEGFPCLAVRGKAGTWCGYVAVAPGHPFYEKSDVNVTAEITYASKCRGRVCHVPKPGQPANVWWLGIDDHVDVDLGWDDVETAREVYKGLEHMRAEVNRLADQARDARIAQDLGGTSDG